MNQSEIFPKNFLKNSFIAIVNKIEKGPHGDFSIALIQNSDVVKSASFALNDDVWTGGEAPEEGSIVVLEFLIRKRAGWKAKKARYWTMNDEKSLFEQHPDVAREVVMRVFNCGK